MLLGQERLHRLRELGGGHGPGLPPHGLALMEQNKCWDALHPELRRGGRVAVHVYFDDFELALVLGGHLLQHGRHSFAGAAPVGIKVYQHRHAWAADKLSKRFLGHYVKRSWGECETRILGSRTLFRILIRKASGAGNGSVTKKTQRWSTRPFRMSKSKRAELLGLLNN